MGGHRLTERSDDLEVAEGGDDHPLPPLFERVQHAAFEYFLNELSPTTGLVLDRNQEGAPASIAATGFGLGAWIVGQTRGWMSREDAIERTLQVLRFLDASDQSGRADSTGHRGFYFHFLDAASGARAWTSELSSIDTALLMVGVLASGTHFDRDTTGEAEVRALSRRLYERVEWDWMLGYGARRCADGAICHGWRPGRGFMPYHWRGYNEALLLYLLALGSPSHPVPRASWQAWVSGYRVARAYDIEYLFGGPLFVHQYTHAWIDLRRIRDAWMREHDSDYFENSCRATRVQQRYAIRNPKRFAHYGWHFWGLSAGDGPGPAQREVDGIARRFHGYAARGAPQGPDDGTVAPWAVVASLPFAPEIVVPTVEAFSHWRIGADHPYGFKASLNPAFQTAERPELGWVSPWHVAINEGPIVLMAENHRSASMWQLMRRCEPIVRGLRAAGFEGGWLDV